VSGKITTKSIYNNTPVFVDGAARVNSYGEPSGRVDLSVLTNTGDHGSSRLPSSTRLELNSDGRATVTPYWNHDQMGYAKDKLIDR
jgi:hypothetical protein